MNGLVLELRTTVGERLEMGGLTILGGNCKLLLGPLLISKGEGLLVANKKVVMKDCL